MARGISWQVRGYQYRSLRPRGQRLDEVNRQYNPDEWALRGEATIHILWWARSQKQDRVTGADTQ